MLGLGDVSIFLAYILCIASALACVIYGIINWNKGAEKDEEVQKDVQWEKEDQEISDDLDV